MLWVGESFAYPEHLCAILRPPSSSRARRDQAYVCILVKGRTPARRGSREGSGRLAGDKRPEGSQRRFHESYWQAGRPKDRMWSLSKRHECARYRSITRPPASLGLVSSQCRSSSLLYLSCSEYRHQSPTFLSHVPSPVLMEFPIVVLRRGYRYALSFALHSAVNYNKCPTSAES